MPIIHITVSGGAAVVGLWTHVSVMPLTTAQDTVVPFGTLLINMVSAILLALTTVKPLLALTPPSVQCMLVALLLRHSSNRGVVNEGSINSMTITPCHSSSVAIVGMVVMTSLIMSPNGVINMATMVCGG
jgi:hypothetical protein